MGSTVSAALPNIKGGYGTFHPNGNAAWSFSTETTASGCCRKSTSSDKYALFSFSTSKYNGFDISIDASYSSSIYKNSATTVVPESLITNFYIKY